MSGTLYRYASQNNKGKQHHRDAQVPPPESSLPVVGLGDVNDNRHGNDDPSQLDQLRCVSLTHAHVLHMAVEIYSQTIAEVHLSLFAYWIQQSDRNYDIAKQHIRELGLDQGYNVERVQNPTLRQLLQDVYHCRPVEPLHAITTKLHMCTISPKTESATKARSVSSPAVVKGKTCPTIYQADQACGVNTTTHNSVVYHISSPRRAYPPDTPDRPAPLSIKPRDSESTIQLATSSTTLRSVSTPVQASRSIISHGTRSLWPNNSYIPRTGLPDNHRSSQHRSLCTDVWQFASDDVFGNASSRALQGQIVPKNYDEISSSAQDCVSSITRVQRTAHPDNSNTKDANHGDCFITERHDELPTPQPPDNEADWLSEATTSESFETKHLFDLLADELASSDMMSASPDPSRSQQTQICSGFLGNPAKEDYSVKTLTPSNTKQLCYEVRQENAIFNKPAFYSPPPPHHHKSTTSLDLPFRNSASPLSKSARFTHMSIRRSKRPISLATGPASPPPAVPLPPKPSLEDACPSRQASRRRSLFKLGWPYHSAKGQTIPEEASFAPLMSYEDKATSPLQSPPFNHPLTSAMAAFPIPPTFNSISTSPIPLTCASPIEHDGLLPFAAPHTLTQARVDELLDQCKHTGSPLLLVRWAKLSPFERTWREVNEKILIALYGRKDVKLDENKVDYVEYIARSIKDELQKRTIEG